MADITNTLWHSILLTGSEWSLRILLHTHYYLIRIIFYLKTCFQSLDWYLYLIFLCFYKLLVGSSLAHEKLYKNSLLIQQIFEYLLCTGHCFNPLNKRARVPLYEACILLRET